MKDLLKFVLLALCVWGVALWVIVKEDWLHIGLEQENRQRGKASYYGEGYRGRIMSNGKLFDPDAMTCASFAYPIGAVLRVSYRLRSVTVQVTDRGPDPRLGRLVDLSRAAFAKLAPASVGVIEVTIERIR